MKRRTILNVLALAVLFGCGPKNDIVGIWSFGRSLPGTDVAMEFKADGTYASWHKGSEVNKMETGTYRIEGGRLKCKKLKIDYGNGKSNDEPKEWESEFRWISEDQFELTDGGSSAKYMRRK